MNDQPDQNEQQPVFEKKTGIAHLFAATRYSLQGLMRLSKEAAFRHEILGLICGLVLLFALGNPFYHAMIFTGLIVLLLAVEALNTAIEEVVDRVSPEFSLAAKNAKDLGSFAVFALILMNLGFMLYAIATRIF